MELLFFFLIEGDLGRKLKIKQKNERKKDAGTKNEHLHFLFPSLLLLLLLLQEGRQKTLTMITEAMDKYHSCFDFAWRLYI
jgi:uncharacterized protein Veg